MSAKSNSSGISRWLAAIFFAAAGTGHFLRPFDYLKIMPPWVPLPLALIYVSGFLEILFGALVLPLKTRKFAGWGLIMLLIAVFPANIHLALHPEIFPSVPAWVDWARLPFQGVFIFWVWKVTKKAYKKSVPLPTLKGCFAEVPGSNET